MLKREALEILGMTDDPDLQVVSERVFDICEYLLAMHERGELRTDFRALPETVTYHAPCQQQGHGIGKPALDLMALVPELRTIETGASCCVAGTYGLKREKYDIAMKVGAGLFGEIADASPDRAVRFRDVSLADRGGHGRAHGASGGDAPPGVRPQLVDGRPGHRLPQRGAGRRRRGAGQEMGGARWRSKRPAGWRMARSAPTPSAWEAVEKVRPGRRARAHGPRERAYERRDGDRDGRSGRGSDPAFGGAARGGRRGRCSAGGGGRSLEEVAREARGAADEDRAARQRGRRRRA